MNALWRSFATRVGIIVLLSLLTMLPGRAPTYAQPATVPDASVAETAYRWIPGSTFQIRDSTSAYATSNGCVYATSSGEFTSAVPVPYGATILSMDMFLFDSDTSAISAVLTLNDSNGMNAPRVLATAAVSTTAGFVVTSAGIKPTFAPYVVNEQQRGLYLEWNPKVFNATMQLCGVRIAYTPAPEPQPATGYRFIVGSNFATRESSTDYGYTGGGCTALKNAGRYLTADLDLPEGAEIFGLTTFFRDATDAADLKVALIEYDGLGLSNTLALATRPISSTAYSSASATLAQPYVVNQATRALVLQVDFGNVLGSSLRFCGARLEYGTQQIRQRGTFARFVAGSTFKPRNWATQYVADNAGCIASDDQNAIEPFIARVDLPQGAKITRIKHFYRHSVSGQTEVQLISYDGTGTRTQLASAVGSSASASPTTTLLPTPFVVDSSQRGLALEWNQGSANASRFFCGAQVEYTLLYTVYLPLIIK